MGLWFLARVSSDLVCKEAPLCIIALSCQMHPEKFGFNVFAIWGEKYACVVYFVPCLMKDQVWSENSLSILKSV
jgi:hypothetical protein